MRRISLLLLLMATALFACAQHEKIETEFFKPLDSYKQLEGQRCTFVKSARKLKFAGIESTKLFNSKIDPETLVGKMATIGAINKGSSYNSPTFLYFKVDGEKKDLQITLNKIEEDFPLDIGLNYALDSARKALVGRVFYNADDKRIKVLNIDFNLDPANDLEDGNYTFTLDIDGKTEKRNYFLHGAHHFGRGDQRINYSSTFGANFTLKSNNATVTKEDIPVFFAVKENKVDNVTEYKSNLDAKSSTTLIFEDITTIAPILVQGRNGSLSWKLVTQYYGDDFIWHKKVIINVNGKQFVTTPDDPITKVMDGGYVFERHIFTGAKEIAVIKAIAENYNKDVAVRFVGEKGRRDSEMELSDEGKKKFKRIYELYQLLQRK
jgi:hypothetical protein